MPTETVNWLPWLAAVVVALVTHQWYLKGFDRWRANRRDFQETLAQHIKDRVCPIFEEVVYSELNQGVSVAAYKEGGNPSAAQRARVGESVTAAVRKGLEHLRPCFEVRRLLGSLRAWERVGKSVCLPAFIAIFLCLVLVAVLPDWRPVLWYVVLALTVVSVLTLVACHVVADRTLHKVEALLEQLEQ